MATDNLMHVTFQHCIIDSISDVYTRWLYLAIILHTSIPFHELYPRLQGNEKKVITYQNCFDSLNSLTNPQDPSLSGVSSSNRGTILPPVAIAINSISGPPTQRTAGSFSAKSKWLASSSKPHWHMAKVAPASWKRIIYHFIVNKIH